MTDREQINSLAKKISDYADEIAALKQENNELKKRVAELEKPKKKHKFRAMTYKEYCKSLYLICEDCVFAPDWADKYYKHICLIRNKSSNDFDKPCKLPNGKYIFREVKE